MPLLLLLPHEFSLLDQLGRSRGAELSVTRQTVDAARTLIDYRLIRQSGNQLHLTLRGQTVLESATMRNGIVLERV